MSKCSLYESGRHRIVHHVQNTVSVLAIQASSLNQ